MHWSSEEWLREVEQDALVQVDRVVIRLKQEALESLPIDEGDYQITYVSSPLSHTPAAPH